MININLVSFSSPWILLSLALLPVIFLFLKTIPPMPKKIFFPSIQYLTSLSGIKKTSEDSPLWLKFLRLLYLSFVIIGLSGPSIDSNGNNLNYPTIILIDNSWATAKDWDKRKKLLTRLIKLAERDKQSVMLLATADLNNKEVVKPSFTDANVALMNAEKINVRSWPPNRKALLEQLKNYNLQPTYQSFWISDDIASKFDKELEKELNKIGRLTVLRNPSQEGPLIIKEVKRIPHPTNNKIKVIVQRPKSNSSSLVSRNIIASHKSGRILERKLFSLGKNEFQIETDFIFPIQLSNQISYIKIEDEVGAGSIFLLDDSWIRYNLGVSSKNPNVIVGPLLDDSFYIMQALSPYAEISKGEINELIKQEKQIIILASGQKVLPNEIENLQNWIERGGILIRFSGPSLQGNVDSLLPVNLTNNLRGFGGTMSWTKPMELAPFEKKSIFGELTIPDDVRVSKHLLAKPSPDLKEKTWASLKDGTPLVTSVKREKGWIILFHITATPEWSSLPISELMVEMLRKILKLSKMDNNSTLSTGEILTPIQTLNGDGILSDPPSSTEPFIRNRFNEYSAGPKHPPGYYGENLSKFALNLGKSINNFSKQDAWNPNIKTDNLDYFQQEISLNRFFLLSALVLFLLDWLCTIVIRQGYQKWFKIKNLIKYSALLLILSTTSFISEASSQISTKTLDATLKTRLAFVESSNPELNFINLRGLKALTKMLASRTSAELAEPTSLNIKKDALFPYPVIYLRIDYSYNDLE